ncbi:MAG: pyrroline-5-carboxylate reductase [Lachnospiraceae bacterium]|nr:pyrroline-5-carboxylate reductase [Lachnospiraceae bacterium]
MDSSKIVGIIGGGNMGGGIAKGIAGANLVSPKNIIVADINAKRRAELEEELGIRCVAGNVELCSEADIIFLAVKPFLLADVIEEIRDYVNEDALVISVVAGQKLEKVEGLFKRNLHLIRIMPNLGAVVGESMTGYTPNDRVTEEELSDAVELFESFGKCERIGENLMDVITAVSGSAPAYVCTFIDAMADAAVLNGMPRAKAYTICEQAVLGTAKYMLETGVSPSELKDMVCTPGGTSIVAVTVMEKEGLRGAVHAGVTACAEKSRNL